MTAPKQTFPGSNERARPEAAVPPTTMTDVFPDFATTPEEVTRRTRMLHDYVREHMVDGEDYGVVPGGSKPTLFKPGAEKLNAVFGFSPLVAVTNRLEDWEAGFVAYEVKVTLLNKRSGLIEAEGIGSCNSRERRYKNQDAAGIANTVLKMARKRALVDATLSATRASGMFTQDLEDIDLDQDKNVAARTVERSAPGGEAPRRAAPAKPQVTNPGEPLSEAQKRAILGIAGEVFGWNSRDEELAKLLDKPVEQLDKGEASQLIDHLRSLPTAVPHNGAVRNGVQS